MADIRVDIRGMTSKKLDKIYREQFPKVVKAAQISAMNITARRIRAEAIREISTESKIKPAKLIRERTAVSKANNKKLSVAIYFRAASMPAEIAAGKSGVRWNRKMAGAKAKSFTFIGAFAAKPHAGKHTDRIRIYMRDGKTGDNKKDLKAQYIPLEQFKPILKRVADRVVAERFEKEFDLQFGWRLEKEIGKLNAKV